MGKEQLKALIETDQSALIPAGRACRELRWFIYHLCNKRPTLDDLEQALENVEHLERIITNYREWMSLVHEILPREASNESNRQPVR